MGKLEKTDFIRMQAYRSLLGKTCVILLVGLAGGAWTAGAASPAATTGTNNLAAAKFFAEKVRPIFEDNCYDCHSEDS